MESKKTKLWSFKSISRQQPTFSNEKVPSFNISHFEHTSLSTSSLISSPSSFYSGSVQYGGAMSASRHNLSIPYIVPKVTQVRKRMKKFKHVTETVTSNSNDTSFTGALSSTARKILQTLEKMSTPLRDFKKIPPPSRMMPMPANFFAKPRRKRLASSNSDISSKKHCPPDKGRTTLGLLTRTTKVRVPPDNSLNTTSSQKEIIPSAAKPIALPPSIFRGKPAVVASFSSSKNVKNFSHTKSGGGKMRSLRKTMHYSNTLENNDKEESEFLLESSVPISMDSLPSFNFNSPGETSTPAPLKPLKKVLPFPGDPCYTFSAPAMAKSPSKLTAACRKSSLKFQFSSPSHTNMPSKAKPIVKPQSAQQIAMDTFEPAVSTLKSGSVMDILGKESDDIKPATKNVAVNKPSLHELFKKPKDKWECEVCMVVNDNSASKCVACESPIPVTDVAVTVKASSNELKNEASKEQSSTSFDESMKDKSSQASKSCSVSVASSASTQSLNTFQSNVSGFAPSQKFSFGVPKATSTESKKESDVDNVTSKKVSFGKPLSESSNKKWASNDVNRPKNETCKNPKPGSAPVSDKLSSSSFSFGVKPQKQAYDWQCDVCLVYNNDNQAKCIACENPKDGAVSTNNTDNTFGSSTFKFGSTSSNVYKFGVPSKSESLESVATTTETTTTKFPASSVSQSSGFTFGNTAVTSNIQGTSSIFTKPMKSSSNINSNPLLPMFQKSNFGATSTSSAIKPDVTVRFGTGNAQFSNNTQIVQSSTTPTSSISMLTTNSCNAENSTTNTIAPSFQFGSIIAKFGSNTQTAQDSSNAQSTATTGLTTTTPSFQFGSKNIQFGNNTQSVQNPTSTTQPDSSSVFTVNSTNAQTVMSASQHKSFETSVSAPLHTFASEKPASSVIAQNSVTTVASSTLQGNNNQVKLSNPLSVSNNSHQPGKFSFAPEVTKPNALPSFNFGSANSASASSSGFGTNLSKSTSSFTFGKSSDVSVTSSKSICHQGFGQNSSTMNQLSGQQPLTFGTSSDSSVASSKSVCHQGFRQNPSSLNQLPGQQSSHNFSFGSSSASGFPNPVTSMSQPGFPFGSSTVMSTVQTATTASSSTAAAGVGFAFGSNLSNKTQQATSGLTFGAASTAPKPTFSFGQVSSFEQTKPGTFQFGASRPTTTPSGGFSFGSSNTQIASQPATGFNFASSSQSQPAFSSNPSGPSPFGASAVNQQQPQLSSSASGFQFNSQSQPFTGFGTSTPVANPSAGTMFNIGQSGGNGRASTPVRPVRRATRRLRK